MNEGAGSSPGHSDGAWAGKHELTVELGVTESNCSWPVLTPFLSEPAAEPKGQEGSAHCRQVTLLLLPLLLSRAVAFPPPQLF